MASPHSRSYSGAAGELRTASELSALGYVAHIPTVDEGADLWAVDHTTSKSHRVQVKLASKEVHVYKDGSLGYNVTFNPATLSIKRLVIVIHIVRYRSWFTLVFKGSDFLKLLPGQLPNAKMISLPKGVRIAMTVNSDVLIGGIRSKKSVAKYRDAWSRAGIKPLVTTAIY